MTASWRPERRITSRKRGVHKCSPCLRGSVEVYRRSDRRENRRGPVLNFGSFLPKFAGDQLADLFRVGMPTNWAGKVRIRDARTVIQNDGIPLCVFRGPR